MNIYLVCTGNTCRSPMAEALLQARQIPGVETRSAGIYALEGGEISEQAKQAIREAGIDYTHMSRQVKEEDIRWADLILTMTTAHKQMLTELYPAAIEKTFTLKEFAVPYGSKDLSDPFGGDLSVYRKTFQELQQLMTELERKLQGDQQDGNEAES